MPVYKDNARGTWCCKCNYKDWTSVSKSKMKRGFNTKKKLSSGKENFYRPNKLVWI